jgi:hypothetical protein
MDPKKEVEKVRKVFEELAAEKGRDDPHNILGTMREIFEEEAVEYVRANTEFPVEKPEKSEKHEYIQLKEILRTGAKEPQVDENGYSEPRPVFNDVTGTLDFGRYNLAVSEKSFLKSNLYLGYIDNPAIIFRERDSGMILFLPRKGESLAIEGAGLEIYTVNEKHSPDTSLEYVYLMMNSKPFCDLFPEGMNHLNLLEGSIPVRTMIDQLDLVFKEKEALKAELKNALDRLKQGAW